MTTIPSGSFRTGTTPPAGDNSNRMATTAYADRAVGNVIGSTTPTMDGTASAGSATTAARSDHVHPSDTSRAALTQVVRNDAAQALTAAQQAQALSNAGLNSTGAISFRNRLLNGAFIVNQLGYVSGTAITAPTHGHDKWKPGSGGCTYTFTQTGPATQITITAGTLLQIMEAAIIEGGSYTLSWTGTATARVYQGTATGSYAASPITVTGLSATTNTTVEFSTGTLGKVQFEPGTAASPFEARPYGLEFQLCQRFIQTGTLYYGGPTNTGTNSYVAVRLSLMYGAPTVTTTNVSNSSYGTADNQAQATASFLLYYRAGTATGGGAWSSTFIAQANL